jgi:hypothetical protein
VAARSVFYIDDVSLQAIEEPALVVSTPLDEYYLGEPAPWTIHTTAAAVPVRIAFLAGGQVVLQQEGRTEGGVLSGTFGSQGLKAGVYCESKPEAPQSARPPT